MTTGQYPHRREADLVAVPGTHEPSFEEQSIVQQPVPPEIVALHEDHAPSLLLHLYRMGDCNIILAREPAAADGSYLWHLSISTPHRHPTWDEIKVARYRLVPLDVCMGMLLPQPGNYINLPQQDHVFHLWEITDPRAPWEGS